MLTKPDCGWTDFTLEGTSTYSLSYLDDIAFDWLTQAIHSLETMLPFCVKGFLEPGRFLCTVSFWNCHIVIENDERYPLTDKDVQNEYAHTSMLDFCKYLYDDISSNVNEWATFFGYDYANKDVDETEKEKKLLEMLERLKTLISERTECFDERHGFL